MYYKLSDGPAHYVAIDASILGEVGFLCAVLVIVLLVRKYRRKS